MKYEKASAEIILFDNSDVITTSGDSIDWTDPGAGWTACGAPSMSQNGICSSMTWN